jgi:mono/diheme cytochrome c family protein
MKTRFALALAALAALTGAPAQAGDPQDPVARGRYLVHISGCNDCHTPNYPQSGGQVPEAEWLTGDSVGFSGPWGVSYPANLRLVVQGMDPKQWRQHARAPRLPPMPWFNVAAMTDADLDAIYRYLRHLGPAGTPAPAAVAPGQPIPTPHIVFVPQPPSGAVRVSAASQGVKP